MDHVIDNVDGDVPSHSSVSHRAHATFIDYIKGQNRNIYTYNPIQVNRDVNIAFGPVKMVRTKRRFIEGLLPFTQAARTYSPM